MLRVEPTNAAIMNFKASESINSEPEKPGKKENKAMIAGTLAGLAAIGAAAIGLKKTAKMSYEDALKKAGVQVKDGIATLIESGEKFTGKIQRFEKRNRKETVEFVDGVMTEKVYHSLTGKELEGEFYKNGKRVLRIWKSVGQIKGSRGFTYMEKNVPPVCDGPFIETKEGFKWAREYVKKHY